MGAIGNIGLYSKTQRGTEWGDPIPRDVREMYDAGVRYLVKKLKMKVALGGGGEVVLGPPRLRPWAILASGEDPNFGLYSGAIKRALRSLIKSQNVSTGYIGPSMYHHGFAMLAFAEAYGAYDDRFLWNSEDRQDEKRSIGKLWNSPFVALSHRKRKTRTTLGDTRRMPAMPIPQSAEQSWSGCWPRETLESKCLTVRLISNRLFCEHDQRRRHGWIHGSLSGFGESLARSSIATLVFSIAKRKISNSINPPSAMSPTSNKKRKAIG